MVKKSKLLLALDAHKGRDYKAEYRKKQMKAAEKRKAAKKAKEEEEKAEKAEDLNEKKNKSQNDEKKENVEVNGEKEEEWTDESGSEEEEEEGSDDEEEKEAKENGHKDDDNEEKQDNEDEGSGDEEEEEEDEDESDIPLSDLSGDERADVIPHQRLTINNSAAISTAIKRISFITPQTPFSEHNSLVSTEPIDVPDPDDDLNRELAFYRVCQAAAVDARTYLKKEGIPFSRPGDYFAEMVKSDEHMGRIKKKLYDEAAAKKAAAEARRQRDLKKFGKQVQIAKLQQRQKEKRETLEKINALKRKRKADKSGPTEEDDPFDVAIEEASKSEQQSRKRGRGDSSAGGPSAKRQKKNEKFGFGGKKRFKKSGDAISSGDLSGFSAKKMKAGAGGAKKRPGKSRRAKMRA